MEMLWKFFLQIKCLKRHKKEGTPMNELELKENDRLFLNGLPLDGVEKYSIEKNGSDDFTRLNVTLLVEIKG
nr:MAG TPA: hypothetical protein [Caudoviricetes sp.]